MASTIILSTSTLNPQFQNPNKTLTLIPNSINSLSSNSTKFPPKTLQSRRELLAGTAIGGFYNIYYTVKPFRFCRKFLAGNSIGEVPDDDNSTLSVSNSLNFTVPTLKLKTRACQFRRKWKLLAGTSIGDSDDDSDKLVVGEDSAAFELGNQKLISWVYFSVILGVVLFALNYLWIDNSTGFGKGFIIAVERFSGSPEVAMLALTIIFAVVHSGLASFRNAGEKIIGERAFRVLFAGVSLPLAVSTVVYFINHRYGGVQLWQVQSVPGIHQLLWLSNFISFLFLYPSTFNLLEVAAVDKPKMHLWETGIIRITRHPQMAGQVIWCLAHTVWIGNSVAVAASIGLIGHHLFGVWNGDRRLALKYGEAFQAVKNRTSIIPFAAILDGRQSLPEDYYKEFIRLPYLAVTVVTLGAYLAHPLMQSASFRLHW